MAVVAEHFGTHLFFSGRGEQIVRVLVAEDSDLEADMLRHALGRLGYEVAVARNGREAFELIRTGLYRLVVSDWEMPEMTGVELSQKLRGLPQYAQTPIIMLTAKGLELDLSHLKTSLGIAAALPKPFSPVEMVKIVHDCLKRTHVAIA